MNKKVLIIVAVAIIVIGGAVAFAVMNNREKKSTSGTGSTSETGDSSYKQRKACDVLTLADAKQLLGDGAEAGSNTPDTSIDDLVVSNCTYTRTGASIKDIKTTSVLVRSPKTKMGAESNKSQFTTNKPANVQDVSGYGEMAFYEPTMGQLNILKDDIWVIITQGGTSLSSKTLDEAKKAADLVVPRI